MLNYAFGLLDQHSAVKYDEQISNLQLDQNYLLYLDLIRNQTLIIDSTAHILFNNKKHVEDQFKIVEQHLTELDNASNDVNSRNEMNIKLNSLSTYTTVLLVRFRSMQQALLDVLTNIQHGMLHPLIISPKDLREQLSKIQNNLP